MTPLQKLPKNVRNLGKIIVAKGFKKLPKVQKIAQSGHTGDIGPDILVPCSNKQYSKSFKSDFKSKIGKRYVCSYVRRYVLTVKL